MRQPVSHHSVRVGSRQPWLIFGLSIVLVLALTSPSGAAGDSGGETITISGDSVPSDCNEGEGAGAIALTGDIEGCLTFFPGDYSCDRLNGFDRFRETGTESFTGSLHGQPGDFTTSYTLEASYAAGFCDQVDAGGFPFELQLTGGCDHTVTGTSGAFEGVTGLITFFDVIPDPGVSGASNFLYAGDLHMPAAESLMYGVNADRSAGGALEGASVSGSIYVWLSPLSPADVDDIEWVDFYVNGTLRHREWKAPYDMISGGDDFATASWNSAEAANGSATVMAVVGLADGSTRTVSATFDIAN